jgi:predicted PurR-regulated permease PerM
MSESNPSKQPCPQMPPSAVSIRYFLLVFAISFYFLAVILWPFWSILVLSFLLTNLFRPFYLLLNRRIPNHVASACTCFLIIAIVFIPLVFFVFTFADEALNLYSWGRDSRIGLKIQMFIQNNPITLHIQEQLQLVGFQFNPTQLSDTFTYLLKEGVHLLYNQASAWAANALQFIVMFFLMIVVIFFLLIDQPRLIEYLIRIAPLPEDENRLLIEKFQVIANAILRGNGICGLIQGTLGGIVFSLLGLNSPILWGCVMAVIAFMPIFGIGLVMIPAALILFFTDRVGAAIFLFVFYLVVSLTVDNFIKPKMVGTQVHMHTLLVFLSILGGIAVYGIIGIIYGPLIVTAFVTLSDIYLKKYDHHLRQ